MPSPPSYGCCTRVNFVLKKHLLFQMNLSNSGLKNRSIKEYWLIFSVLKFPLGLQFSHNLTKFKIIKYISTIYIMTTTCTYLQQLTQVSDVAHGPLVFVFFLIKVCPFFDLEFSKCSYSQAFAPACGALVLYQFFIYKHGHQQWQPKCLVKGRFLQFRMYHNFACLFSKLLESTFYKEK